MIEIAVEQDLVVLLQSWAYSEGEKGSGPVIGVYSRKGEGKLVTERLGWERGTMVNFAPVLHRGRLYTLDRSANGQGIVLGAPFEPK
jgi:hypothetical protein